MLSYTQLSYRTSKQKAERPIPSGRIDGCLVNLVVRGKGRDRTTLHEYTLWSLLGILQPRAVVAECGICILSGSIMGAKLGVPFGGVTIKKRDYNAVGSRLGPLLWEATLRRIIPRQPMWH